MDASDLIKTLQKHLARRGPSTYGYRTTFTGRANDSFRLPVMRVYQGARQHADEQSLMFSVRPVVQAGLKVDIGEARSEFASRLDPKVLGRRSAACHAQSRLPPPHSSRNRELFGGCHRCPGSLHESPFDQQPV
jgi:hypothetical protein